ncbi:MAG: ATP synthase F1 subunit gamma [Luteibaculaceae bacterium]
MANLKEIRVRINSVNSTRKITSAMKMVSAAKLKKAQDAITQFRPYANKLTEILANVSASLEQGEGVYSQVRAEKNVLFIAVNSNRGLCGGFNSAIVKKIQAEAANYKHANVKVVSMGKKAFDVFKKTDMHLANEKGFAAYPYQIYDNLNYGTVAEVAENVMHLFANGSFDKVFVVYNQFKNAAVQFAAVEQMLPLLPKENEESNTNATDYIFEPEKGEIVETLIPKSIKTQLYKAFLDSTASEHGARMTAMHKATDNATALLKDLKLKYNKARQASITNEILEISAGAEALNG